MYSSSACGNASLELLSAANTASITSGTKSPRRSRSMAPYRRWQTLLASVERPNDSHVRPIEELPDGGLRQANHELCGDAVALLRDATPAARRDRALGERLVRDQTHLVPRGEQRLQHVRVKAEPRPVVEGPVDQHQRLEEEENAHVVGC